MLKLFCRSLRHRIDMCVGFTHTVSKSSFGWIREIVWSPCMDSGRKMMLGYCYCINLQIVYLKGKCVKNFYRCSKQQKKGPGFNNYLEDEGEDLQ